VKDRYARDPAYGKPPRWSSLYRRFFPTHTDGCSRHVVIIAEDILRDPKSPVRRWLIDQGYEPDHWASSMEATVRALWAAREEIAELKGPERFRRERDAMIEKVLKRMRRRQKGSEAEAA